MDWQHSGSPHPKKFRVSKSAGKVLASVFWDQYCILLIDYFPKGQTINVEYYSSTGATEGQFEGKMPRKVTKEILFLHDNAPAHRTLATHKKLAYLGFQCLDHPPYSPDLALLDYHLFPGLILFQTSFNRKHQTNVCLSGLCYRFHLDTFLLALQVSCVYQTR